MVHVFDLVYASKYTYVHIFLSFEKNKNSTICVLGCCTQTTGQWEHLNIRNCVYIHDNYGESPTYVKAKGNVKANGNVWTIQYSVPTLYQGIFCKYSKVLLCAAQTNNQCCKL